MLAGAWVSESALKSLAGVAAALLWTGVIVLALTLDALAGESLPEPSGPVLLTVDGRILNAQSDGVALFDRAMLESLPQRTVVTSTRWTDGAQTFEGPLIRDLLERVEARGSRLLLRALNDFEADMPVSDAYDFDVILALSMNGEPLLRRDKGPIWVIYPRDTQPIPETAVYNARWVWQLSEIEVQ